MSSHWKREHTASLVVFTLAIILAPAVIPIGGRVWAWALVGLLLILFIAVTGHGVTGLWRGALIDERNQISLSRFQLAVWTVIVLSGLLTIAIYNIGESADPLAIAIPTELWALLGISTASLVGSPLVRSTKEDKKPDPKEKAAAIKLLAQRYGAAETDFETRGLIVANTQPEMARWANMMLAEETGNAGRLDLSKIQMFFFTLILAIAYAFALGDLLAGDSQVIAKFPPLTGGMVALLGISHAGYLTHKATPHSKQV